MQTPMPAGLDNELGIAGGVAQSVTGPCFSCGTIGRLGSNTGLTSQIWYRHRFENDFRVGLVASAGYAYSFSGGLRLEIPLYSSDLLQLSANVECGWYWCGGGLPLAFQTEKGGLWIYGGPFAGATAGGDSVQPIFRVPLGFALPIGDRAMFLGEVNALYRPTFVGEGAYDGHILFFVAGVGFAARM